MFLLRFFYCLISHVKPISIENNSSLNLQKNITCKKVVRNTFFGMMLNVCQFCLVALDIHPALNHCLKELCSVLFIIALTGFQGYF